MAASVSGPKDQLLKCLRCSSAMLPGFLSVQQQSFPFEWVMQLAELNGPDGRNVYGWGDDARRSSGQRLQIEASRRRVTAMRCEGCGMIELKAV